MKALLLVTAPLKAPVAPPQPKRPARPPKLDRRGLHIGQPPIMRQPFSPRGGRR